MAQALTAGVICASCIATLAAAQAGSRLDLDRRPDSFTVNPAEISKFPEPEIGAIAAGAYSNRYFGLRYLLPPEWTEGYAGPPPSDTGYYVLSSFKHSNALAESAKGTVLIAAWDQFFVSRPVTNALELVRDMKQNLSDVYSVEMPPVEVKMANRSFARLDYVAPAAGLHWRVLATDVRCHTLQFVFTSHDTALLDGLVKGLNQVKLPDQEFVTSGTAASGGPVCVKDYATGSKVLHKVDPNMVGARFTTVPVRFVIGTDGHVKHIHVINAFPDQAKSIENALVQWVLKPYVQKGVATEVETGISFHFPPRDAEGRSPGKEGYW